MSVPTHNLIRSATDLDEPFNIIWFSCDGTFEHLLFEHTQHNYYCIPDKHNPWHLEMWPPSSNVTILNNNVIPAHLEYDFIVCNNKLVPNVMEAATHLSNTLHIPLLMIEHTLPTPNLKNEDILILNDQKTDMVVATSVHVNNGWGDAKDIIPYGFAIEPPLQLMKNNKAVIVGQAGNNTQQLRQIIEQSPIPITLIGDNPGLSTNCSQEALFNVFANSKYIINISAGFTTPITMLMAMTFGCIPIANRNVFTEEIVKETGYLFDNINDLFSCLQKCMKDKPKYTAEDVQNFVINKFPQQAFLNSWNDVFTQMNRKVYTR